MNYITELVEDDLRYICSLISYKETSDYFRKYPKEFYKLRPGFRVKSLQKDDIIKTLYDFRNTGFIASFITRHISQWLKEINTELYEVKQTGLNEEETYINVLARSVFAHNVPLFFRIIKEEKSEEYLHLLSSGVNQLLKLLEETTVEINKHKEELGEKADLIRKQKNELEELVRKSEKLQDQLSRINLDENRRIAEIAQKDEIIKVLQAEISKLSRDLTCLSENNKKITVSSIATQEMLSNQIDELKRQISEYEIEVSALQANLILTKNAEEESQKRELLITDMQETIQSLNEYRISYEETINELEAALEEARHANSSLSESGDDSSRLTVKTKLVLPQRPVDMEDFDDYFNYNLNNIGFDKNCEAYTLFVRYLENIVFKGMPLLIKHGPGVNLANCLANTLHGQQLAAILSYSENAGMQEIKEFLTHTPDRVVCIDGFIGNCNEMEMIPLLEQYRDKIIILTYMYDRTLNYVPMEILAYMQYVNVDEFAPLLRIKDITEDPSEIIEEPFALRGDESPDNNRYKKIFREIAEQCGICRDVINTISDSIEEEDYMNSVLMFSLLPYVAKVMCLNPYNCSKRLQKYAGESGKCPQKSIVLRWFG